MGGEVGSSFRAICSRVLPDIRSIPTRGPQSHVILVSALAVLEQCHQLMLRTVEAAHPAAIRLYPDNDVEQRFVVSLASCKKISDGAPVHEDIVERS